jgi:triacylglycerol lipase
MKDTIVLLHGLGRTSLSMSGIALAARMRGYRVINWHYRSLCGSIESHAAEFARRVLPRLAGRGTVHFITHSLGGIIVRQVLAKYAIPNLGRVVMVAPPNRGSEVADVLQRNVLVARVPAARELGTGEGSVPLALPEATFPVGVIAGSRSHIPIFDRWMNGVPNDGVVAVERTRLPGMTDFLELPHTHTFLPWAPDAIRAAFRFLETARFAAAA